MATKDTGVVNIHGKEYKTVAARVQEFRKEYPAKDQWAIATKVIARNDEEVVMKAEIRWSTTVMATGHAEEKRSSSQINRTSALENAETSAIGRALAAFGMAGSEYASADEVAQAIHQQSVPAQQSGSYGTRVRTPTEKQLAMIASLSKQLGIDKDMYEQRIALLSTSAEASVAIEKLQARLSEKGEE